MSAVRVTRRADMINVLCFISYMRGYFLQVAPFFFKTFIKDILRDKMSFILILGNFLFYKDNLKYSLPL